MCTRKNNGHCVAVKIIENIIYIDEKVSATREKIYNNTYLNYHKSSAIVLLIMKTFFPMKNCLTVRLHQTSWGPLIVDKLAGINITDVPCQFKMF